MTDTMNKRMEDALAKLYKLADYLAAEGLLTYSFTLQKYAMEIERLWGPEE